MTEEQIELRIGDFLLKVLRFFGFKRPRASEDYEKRIKELTAENETLKEELRLERNYFPCLTNRDK